MSDKSDLEESTDHNESQARLDYSFLSVRVLQIDAAVSPAPTFRRRLLTLGITS